MKQQPPVPIRTIRDFHRLRGIPGPGHPLISVVDYRLIQPEARNAYDSWVMDFYSISMKRTTSAKIRYGQQDYDFDNGILFFMAPGQVFRIEHGKEARPEHTGWILLIHPDFFRNTALAKNIKKYAYFDYAVNEALFLSEKEEATLGQLVGHIQQEYSGNLDKFSQQIIIAHIETLLHYAERFYQRQFLTRQVANHEVLDRLEALLTAYFDRDDLASEGLPDVQYVAQNLHLSASYLGSLLKTLTGRSTQQHIHDKLIEKAKEKLSTTGLSINEIAYELGFGHAASFSKLFKSKTQQSPLAFRQGFY